MKSGDPLPTPAGTIAGQKTLAIVAGGGSLPAQVAEGAKAAGVQPIMLRLQGQGAEGAPGVASREFPIGAVGAMARWMREQGASEVCFAGAVRRPDFKSIRPDKVGLKALPSIVGAARMGDDALLSAVSDMFAGQGFTVVPPQRYAQHLLAPVGPIGRMDVPAGARGDIVKACEVAREVGRLDIGQAAVVCDGLVLAVEAQEGTAAMVARVGGLSEAIRGTPDLRNGILAKMLKPAQDGRTDLPTIGPDTVRAAAAAGIAGIVVEAGQSFVLDRAEVARLADAAGMFVLGLPEA